MSALAAQPAEEHAYQHAGVQPVGLGPTVLARYGDACRVDDMRFDAASSEPARQPKSVTACLIGQDDACNRPARFHRLRPPAFYHRSSPSGSDSSFFTGSRSMPGIIPATSQLAALISTAMVRVLF